MGRMFRLALSFRGAGLQSWDTSNVRFMDKMFDDAVSLQADLGNFQTSKVITMRRMFHGTQFASDISHWNVSSLVDASQFLNGAVLFDHSLCTWGPQLDPSVNVFEMFKGTQCPLAATDPRFSLHPPGPFCYDCCCRETVESRTEGPHETPVIPVAGSPLPDGRIVIWSAYQR